KFAGAAEDGLVPVPRRVRLVVKIVERSATPQAAWVLDQELASLDVEGHGVGRVSLELEGVRARRGGGVNDLQRSFQALVVIAAHLSDEEGRVLRANRVIAKLDRSVPRHGCQPNAP